MSNEHDNSHNEEEEIEFADLQNTEVVNPLQSGGPEEEEQSSEQELTTAQKEAALPEKFKGKSAEEIAEAYRNLERELGRKNNELGELRGKVDTLLDIERGRSQQGKDTTEQPKQVTDDDFWESPTQALNKAFESSPYAQKINQLEQQLSQRERTEKLNSFQSKHPDFQSIVQRSDFQEWVNATPKRQELFYQADNHDYDAADELLSTFKEIKKIKQQEEEEARDMSDKESLKEAQVERSGNGGAKKKGKYFRRADIIDLKINNPSRYQALLPEIKQAAQEGRIK